MLRVTCVLSRLRCRPNLRCTPAFGVFLRVNKNSDALRNVPAGKRFAAAHALFRKLKYSEKQRYARLGMTRPFLRPLDKGRKAKRLAAKLLAEKKKNAAPRQLTPFAVYLKSHFHTAPGATVTEKMKNVAKQWRESKRGRGQ